MNVTKNIVMVSTAQLTGKEAFQRDINIKRVERIAENWDNSKMKPIQVADINGKLVIWDGQHTAAAARMVIGNKDLKLPCIIDKMTKEEAAEHVANQNKNKCNLNSIEQFNASVESADPDDFNIHRMLMQEGISLKKSYTTSSTAAVGALRSVYKDSCVNLAQTFEIIRKSWVNDDDRYRSDIIMGVGRLVRIYGGKFKTSDITDRLKKKSAITYIRDAQTNKVLSGSNRMVALFVKEYNRGRTELKRLDEMLLMK